MRSYLPEILPPPLDWFEILEVYLFYDQPIVFSGFNSSGRFFAGMVMECTGEKNVWVFSQVDIITLHEFQEGKISYYEVMNCFPKIHQLVVTEGFKTGEVDHQRIYFKDLPKPYQEVKKVFLNIDREP